MRQSQRSLRQLNPLGHNLSSSTGSSAVLSELESPFCGFTCNKVDAKLSRTSGSSVEPLPNSPPSSRAKAGQPSTLTTMRSLQLPQQGPSRSRIPSRGVVPANAEASAGCFTCSSVPNTGRGGQASVRPQALLELLPSTARCAVRYQSRPTWNRIEDSLQRRGFRVPAFSSGLNGCFVVSSRRTGLRRLQPRRSLALAALAPGKEAVPAAGCLVEFRKDRDRTGFALIQEPDGKRNWRVVDVQGISHSLKPQQILYILPGNEYTVDDMQQISGTADESASDASVMEDAWEVVREAEEQFLSVPEMADLLFNAATPATCCAAHRLLTGDRTFFKQVGRSPPAFQARTERDVAAARTRLEAERRAEELKAARLTAFREAIAQPLGQKPKAQEWFAGPWASSIQMLQDFALEELDPEVPSELAQGVLELTKPLIRASTPQAAAQLLRHLGVWAPHLHPTVVRAGLSNDFPEIVLTEARDMMDAPPEDPDANKRRDLRHLRVWAVDSADTSEVDDGVSVELSSDGRHRFWVHVADPTRWLRYGSALEREAARRASTLYLPTGSISMFPREVAEGLFSMQTDTAGCALSISMVLDESGAIAECEAMPSLVHPIRLTYNALDERLASTDAVDEELQALREASELRRRWREQQGAVTINIPESEIKVSEPDSIYPDISFSPVTLWESPARSLVSELMIMGNEAVASMGEKAGLPMPYRGQAEVIRPSEEELEPIPEGVCRDSFIRGRMTRTVCTAGSPQRHAGLGLPGYVQATSPIRRYADLLAHWQLKAHLRGEKPPMDADTLGEAMEAVQARVRECNLVDREVAKYWATEFFSRQLRTYPSHVYEATLLSWIRGDTGFAKAILKEFAFETVLWIQRPATLGETLRLVCTLADGNTAELRFEEVESPGATRPTTGTEDTDARDDTFGEEDAGMAVNSAVEHETVTT